MAAETALQTTEQNEAAAADYGADPKGESSIPAAVVAFRCDMKLLRPLYSAMLVQVLRGDATRKMAFFVKIVTFDISLAKLCLVIKLLFRRVSRLNSD